MGEGKQKPSGYVHLQAGTVDELFEKIEEQARAGKVLHQQGLVRGAEDVHCIMGTPAKIFGPQPKPAPAGAPAGGQGDGDAG